MALYLVELSLLLFPFTHNILLVL
uniref:Uncharacterized protein n=1 Tax=Arundo donax TaxID=35708 RepID=A0A0A9ALL1_ARUDO